MDDDESRDRPGSRPPTAQRVSRPAFGELDDDSFGLDSSHSRASPTIRTESGAAKPSTGSPALIANHAPPPSRPLPAESSYLASMVDDSAHDTMTEQAVRAHLQDVESSFLAPLSPLPTITANGVDDTYLFDGAPTLPKPESPTPARRTPSPAKSTQPPATAAAESLPALKQEESDAADTSNTTSELETFSSPTAAATARTVSRAVSMASAHAHGVDTSEYRAAESSGFDLEQVPSLTPSESISGGSAILRHQSSDQSLSKQYIDAGSTPGHSLRVGKRPKYLRSRNASQRSSVSSFATNADSHDEIDSDLTVGMGADYALQSGGALPALGRNRSISNMLSRSVSMGSMASGIDDFHDSGSKGFDQLGRLDENDGNLSPQRPKQVVNEEMLMTPKASRDPLLAPTDTVIARHVRNVEVPETVAREYKSKAGLETPRKSSDFTIGGTSRTGRNMTLKEQSSTIERLSKENFDLKLKVMFLSDRLSRISEEGIKEMISENVELKTSVAILQRDNKGLRRRVKELEKQLKDEDERPGTAKSSTSDTTAQFFDQEAQDREEELLYLRERVEEYTVEIERMRQEAMAKEMEKRKLAEAVRAFSDRTSDNLGRQEEADVWKDLLEQETARREQADEDNRKLREEMFRLKQEMTAGLASGGTGGAGGMHHTTNIYNITKKPRGMSPGRPVSGLSGEMDGMNGALSATSTLVEELRREGEQLRHENAELRREVGAQTSMLTSRNREKERLYQEIEDLKMAQRRGNPAPSTIDSLLDRSASRAGMHHQRSHSRGSGVTRITQIPDDPDREEMENKMAEMRDKINEVKLQNQELQRELDGCMEDFETAVEAKRQAEELALGLQEDLETAMNDLVALQAERDEALRDQADMETEFEALRKEAQEEIDHLEAEADQRTEELQRLQLELNDRAENFDALQEEMRKMSEALVRLEDEQVGKLRRISQLEGELADANKELEELEAKLVEANDKNNRLVVQQESSQGEIAFLREEQESDKIRIGDLEAALANAEQSLREERDRTRELEQRLATERRQREILATREKEEVQQFVNELNREASAAKDEARKLRKNLTSREVEATEWKERLMELENNLREALGDLNGTRSSLLKSIAKLQRELENTVRELDATKAALVEKDRIIKQRDSLLESHGLESRKLAELLEKERQGHRNTKHQFETFQKTHQHVTRTVTTQDSRIVELENGRAQDKKKLAQLELTFREQLTERNNLLLTLWTRLSTLCGTDWAHDNSLINGRALPSLESVATMLPGFSKNLMAAVKMIETIIGGFQGRIKSVERDLWREYQALENNLEVRTKKLERLETIVRNGVATGSLGVSPHEAARVARLEEAYRQLKVENATLRTANDVRARAAYSSTGDPNGNPDGSGSPSPGIPTGPRDRDRSRRGASASRSATMTRSSSSHGVPAVPPLPPGTSSGLSAGSAGALDMALAERDPPGAPDNKWMFRLRDLEYKLKMEREARNQDRSAARQRLGGLELENRDLRGEVARMKRANGTGSEVESQG